MEMEIREVLDEFGFDSEKTPIVIGSALNTLEVRTIIEPVYCFCLFFHPYLSDIYEFNFINTMTQK